MEEIELTINGDQGLDTIAGTDVTSLRLTHASSGKQMLGGTFKRCRYLMSRARAFHNLGGDIHAFIIEIKDGEVDFRYPIWTLDAISGFFWRFSSYSRMEIANAMDVTRNIKINGMWLGRFK